MVIVGDCTGSLHIFLLREKVTQNPNGTEMQNRAVPAISELPQETLQGIRQGMLESQSQLSHTRSQEGPISSSQKSGDLQKRLSDPKYAYGYFVNRSKMHKQSTQLYSLEHIITKKLESKLQILNIQVNNSQTRVYVSHAEGVVRIL